MIERSSIDDEHATPQIVRFLSGRSYTVHGTALCILSAKSFQYVSNQLTHDFKTKSFPFLWVLGSGAEAASMRSEMPFMPVRGVPVAALLS